MEKLAALHRPSNWTWRPLLSGEGKEIKRERRKAKQRGKQGGDRPQKGRLGPPLKCGCPRYCWLAKCLTCH